jgi:hypothetical protein
MFKSVNCKALLCMLRQSLDDQRACLLDKMSESSNDARSCSEEDVLTNKRRQLYNIRGTAHKIISFSYL